MTVGNLSNADALVRGLIGPVCSIEVRARGRVTATVLEAWGAPIPIRNQDGDERVNTSLEEWC